MSSIVSTLNSVSVYANYVANGLNTAGAIIRAYQLSQKEKLTLYEKISFINNITFASLTITLAGSKAYNHYIAQTELSPDFQLKMNIAISGFDVFRTVSDKLSNNFNRATTWTTDDTVDTIAIILFRTSNCGFLSCKYRPDLSGDKVRNTAYACQSVALILEKRKPLHDCVIRAIVYSKLILSTEPSEELNNIRAN